MLFCAVATREHHEPILVWRSSPSLRSTCVVVVGGISVCWCRSTVLHFRLYADCERSNSSGRSETARKPSMLTQIRGRFIVTEEASWTHTSIQVSTEGIWSAAFWRLGESVQAGVEKPRGRRNASVYSSALFRLHDATWGHALALGFPRQGSEDGRFLNLLGPSFFGKEMSPGGRVRCRSRFHRNRVGAWQTSTWIRRRAAFGITLDVKKDSELVHAAGNRRSSAMAPSHWCVWHRRKPAARGMLWRRGWSKGLWDWRVVCRPSIADYCGATTRKPTWLSRIPPAGSQHDRKSAGSDVNV